MFVTSVVKLMRSGGLVTAGTTLRSDTQVTIDLRVFVCGMTGTGQPRAWAGYNLRGGSPGLAGRNQRSGGCCLVPSFHP